MSSHRTLTLIPVLAALLACKAAGASKPSPVEPSGSAESAERAASEVVPASDPASSTSPVAVSVVEGRARVADTGFLHITGEVRNDSGRPIRLVRVDIQLFDAQGKLIGVDSIAAADGHGESALGLRETVPPGEVDPFHYIRDVAKLSRRYASHKLFARALPADGKIQATVEGVEVAHEKIGDTEYLRVTGTVKNTGSECMNPKAVIAYYDQAGKVYAAREGVSDWSVGHPFGPGASVGFTTGPFDTQGVVKDVKVWGDCREP
jgi:hypothetical protein